MKNSQKVIDYRRRRKTNLIKVCGAKCNICGYNKTQDALDFHHLNKDEKKYTIGSKGVCHDLSTDLSEIKKCILVCANCHREIHAGLINKVELESKKIFNEEYANQLIDDKRQLLTKTLYYCSNCGIQLYEQTQSGLCRKCFNKINSSHIPTREKLKNLIQQYSFVEIGRQYGVSDNAIRKWCKKYNLPFQSSVIKKITNWDII